MQDLIMLPPKHKTKNKHHIAYHTPQQTSYWNLLGYPPQKAYEVWTKHFQEYLLKSGEKYVSSCSFLKSHIIPQKQGYFFFLSRPTHFSKTLKTQDR